MDNCLKVGGRGYAGFFLITLATLMYEILLTRIFSVTMWYHFAFMAISVTMFGMTVGAILVYLRPNRYTAERAKTDMASNTVYFAIGVIFTFLIQLCIPFVPSSTFMGVFSAALTFTVIAVPFVFSGVCVCIALTKFPRQVSRLYATDLAGAALGCLLLIYLLDFTDGPTAVVFVSAIASMGALLFAMDADSRIVRRLALATTVVLVLFGLGNTWLVQQQKGMIRLMWVKGKLEERPLYEKWNSFSRVKVDGNLYAQQQPFGWGFSSKMPDDLRVRRLHLDIDAAAATVVTAFDGDIEHLEHLKFDITNLAHHLRDEAEVLVVGIGGGRDLLSALAFEQKHVLGIELNKAIIEAVNDIYGDFTGHLDGYPNIEFVNDEARSYIARSKNTYDILQISLIDTWAATAAGAFVLAENSLYTVEAWTTFLERLKPNGILTVSRWYFKDRPGETYRTASLARATLEAMGIENPRDHMMIVAMTKPKLGDVPDGIGTLLLSRQPFSDADIDKVEQVAKDLDLELVVTPRETSDETFAELVDTDDFDGFLAGFPLNISPPTDNSPFFFNMLRLRDAFNKDLWRQGMMGFNMKAIATLARLLLVVFVLTFLCIIVPLILTTKKEHLKGSLFHFLFFAGIGLGFMFVEISQMQRLIVFLGHPVYGLSVALFAVLLSSGIGSFTTGSISGDLLTTAGRNRMLGLLAILILFGLLTPYAIRMFDGAVTLVRILVAIAILSPLGLFMGMAFPIGLRLAARGTHDLTPWLWGINGATSVCASVLAVAIALNSSISTTFWVGFCCYVVATACFSINGRRHA
ncbi:MAG: hypothetical protein KJ626_14180 [Verrucomicrobia bacterium]|nr:hypothetical protein [Verrucomicrobiota bacterium]